MQKQDLELTMAQIISFPYQKLRLKLKKARKTTRSAMYNLNQIPYTYTVEVTNTIQGIRSSKQCT